RRAPARDQSSVPRMPNARSAFVMNSAIIRRHTSPSPLACRSSSTAFASVLVARNAASPSGNSVAVGCSVFRYSSPRCSSSPLSSAWAAPPTQSGCHPLNTSWRNPSSVSSAVLTAPPSSSSASSTHTRLPPRARSAAAASELIPLPTIATSKSGSVTSELSELVVRHEPALPRAEILDALEKLTLRVGIEVEPELLCLDPDRVEPALLAEDDASCRVDDTRRVRLHRGRVVELARDCAGLPREQVVADKRLVRLELVAAQLAQPLRERPHALELQVRFDPVEPAERERDLRQVRVAGALAHAVDRPVDPARALTGGSERRSSREPEVVMAVEVDGDVRPDP